MFWIRNINVVKNYLNICFMWLIFICVVLEDMRLEYKFDINNWDVYRNEYDFFFGICKVQNRENESLKQEKERKGKKVFFYFLYLRFSERFQ